MTPDFPSAFYGRVFNITGMEYCYTANSNAYINWVAVYHNSLTSGAEATPYTWLVNDLTDRTDAACRNYSITPKGVDENTVLSVWVDITWGSSGAGVQARLGRVTFFFQSTNTLVAAPKALETFGDGSLDIRKPTPK